VVGVWGGGWVGGWGVVGGGCGGEGGGGGWGGGGGGGGEEIEIRLIMNSVQSGKILIEIHGIKHRRKYN
jgi:hypothetical protein